MARRESSSAPSVLTITRGETAMEIWWNANIAASWDTEGMSVSRSMDIQLDNSVANKTPSREMLEITKTETVTMVVLSTFRGIGMETALLKVTSEQEGLMGTTPGMTVQGLVRL